MSGEQKETLELNTPIETQERAPEVSADKKKQEEVDQTTQKTEIVLTDLKKKIEVIKTSQLYSSEIKHQAEIIESELEYTDVSDYAKQAERIALLEKIQNKEDDLNSLSSLWKKVKGAFTMISAFFAGKKTWRELSDYFSEKREDKKEELKQEKNNEKIDGNTQQVRENEEKYAEEQVYQEYLKTLEKGYTNLDRSFIEAWAHALAAGKATFEQDGKTFYFAQDRFVSADKAKFDRWIETNGSIGMQSAEEGQEPLPESGEADEMAAAQAQEQQMKDDGFNELYILSRMAASGYLPSKLYGWRRKRGPINRTIRGLTNTANAAMSKSFDLKVVVGERLIPSMRDRLIREKVRLISQGISQHDYDTHLKTYEAMRKDITEGKVTTLDELNKKYPDMIDTKRSAIEKILHSKNRPLERAHREIRGKIETYEQREQVIRDIDTEMNKLQEEMKVKYAELDALDKQAVKDPAKEKQLRADVTKITNEYNKQLNNLNVEAGLSLKGATSGEVVRLERYNVIKNLAKANGGHMNLIEKANAKGGRVMFRIGVAGLAWRAGQDVMNHGFLSKETALDATDMAAGFIPVAGGLYDVGMAIYGKDLNGREMSTADRWIRGTIGVGTAVLDVFTFGAGGTAIRAGVKGTTTAVKVVEGAVKTERALKTGELIYKGAKTFTHGAMFLGMCYGVGVNFYDVAVTTKDGGEFTIDKVQAATEENKPIAD